MDEISGPFLGLADCHLVCFYNIVHLDCFYLLPVGVVTLAPKKAYYRKLREVNLKKLKKERYDWGKLCLCVLLSDLFVQIKVLLQCISHLCGSTFCNWNTALQWSTTANHGRSKYSVLAQWSTVQYTLLRNVSLVWLLWFVWLEIGCRCFYVRTVQCGGVLVAAVTQQLRVCKGGDWGKDKQGADLVIPAWCPGCHLTRVSLARVSPQLDNQAGQSIWATKLTNFGKKNACCFSRKYPT